VLPAHETERIVLKLKPEAHDFKMEELFALMLDKGIKSALDVVVKLNDPHLTDDFHRFLVQYLHTIGAIPGLSDKKKLEGELDHTLFTVTLPNSPETEKDFKHFLQAMKQFYVGMQQVTSNKQYYTLELATQNKGKNIALYASIPRLSIELFEKLVHAYYPGASIEEAVDDYNIFSENGSGIAGAKAELKELPIYPLQTDQHFEHDPLVALIGSLSQLEEDGEGAAIQIVISKDEKNSNDMFETLLDDARKHGGEVRKMYKERTESILEGVGKGLWSLFESEKEEKPKEQDPKGIELLEQKNNSPIVAANLRILASARTLDRSKQILDIIKATFNQFSMIGGNKM